MQYNAELNFFLKLLTNFNLPATIFSSSEENIPEADLGLRRQIFGTTFSFKNYFHDLTQLQDNTIYWYHDAFLCRYVTLKLPTTVDDRYLVIGPYLQESQSQQTIQEMLEHYSVPPKLFPQFEKYYNGLTILSDETSFFTIINTFGEQLWDSFENFKTVRLDHPLPKSLVDPPTESEESGDSTDALKDSEDAFLKMSTIERQYTLENQLMQAVSQGLTTKAEMLFPTSATQGVEPRLSDSIRNQKNYTIILNTLLRKAAEYGTVPYIHIDSLSSKFAHKIELIHSPADALALRREMVHKYCLLVKNHSMKGYSLLVRKVLTYIDADLTADLGLRAQAERLNVNASYLSTLFKKETGTTLTDYVNRKRIDHALLLLNATNLQIQTIAQYCGIPDVNYFTKTFKKHTGMTPKEYRSTL